MNKIPIGNLKFLILALLFGIVAFRFMGSKYGGPFAEAGQAPVGKIERTPWTTSRVTGSPEPPHPYNIERAFPKLTFKNPLLLTMAPGSNRFFVGEQAGKIYSFPNDPNTAKADLFVDVAKDLQGWDKATVRNLDALYGLAFHPQFTKNRYCYVCYVLNSKTPGKQLADGSRVSRFRVTDTDPPRCDPSSEKVIITWLAGGISATTATSTFPPATPPVPTRLTPWIRARTSAIS